MLYELLLLGDEAPQVIAFALEQEVNYYAPPFRRRGEGADPLIRHREPSDTRSTPRFPWRAACSTSGAGPSTR
jgi:hypothetical protein